MQSFKNHFKNLTSEYALLPFRLLNLNHNRYFLSNFAGDYVLVSLKELRDFIFHRLTYDSETYNLLKSRGFLIDEESSVVIDLLATQYRTKQSHLSHLASLFMIVTTLRCNGSCSYCQVLHQGQEIAGYDMTLKTAGKTIDFIFSSPSPIIKVEFQGGDSLLNFNIVKYIIQEVESRNKEESRDIEYVVTTNLYALDEDVLAFCLEYNVYLSTSFDGPKDLHNHNRGHGYDSYAKVKEKIELVQKRLGKDKISALMTTTKQSMSCPEKIIDEYVQMGFRSIFLRSLNPYGLAASENMAYSTEKWLQFYKRALRYIIAINQQGTFFCEEYSAIVLKKILTPFPNGFVDLQSPAGLAISGIVINYDGSIYPSDESRMLAEMGDTYFKMGNVFHQNYSEIIQSNKLKDILGTTMTECVPMCSDCGFQPYCGSDPVRYFRMQQGDIVGFKPTSDFCQKNIGVIRHLIMLLEDNSEASSILKTWI